MATRTRKPKVETIDTADQLGAFIERVAADDAAGEHSVIVTVPGAAANLKGVVDRIRRVPRVKGWNALSVAVGETTEDHVGMTITNTGTAAAAWPTKKAAAPAKPAKKAPAKRARKAAAAK